MGRDLFVGLVRRSQPKGRFEAELIERFVFLEIPALSRVLLRFHSAETEPPTPPGRVHTLCAHASQCAARRLGLCVILRDSDDHGATFPYRILIDVQLILRQAPGERLFQPVARHATSDPTGDRAARGAFRIGASGFRSS